MVLILAGPGMSIDPVRAVVVLACFIWFAVLVGFVAVYGPTWIARTFRGTRGYEPDGIYCTACRFDVRGATSERCPECGSHLFIMRGAIQRPGITTRGLHPPFGLSFRLLIYALFGFAISLPLVLTVGSLLPINYRPHVLAELTNPNSSSADSLSICVEFERTWTNDYIVKEVHCWEADYRINTAFNAAGKRDEASVQLVWEDVVSNKPLLLPLAEREVLREEFIAVFLAACDFDEQRARRSTERFDLFWEPFWFDEFHPLYVVFGFATVITVMIFLMFRSVKDTDRAHQLYADRLDELEEHYRRMLQQNR
ncbi:MAG: hypothetical protein AAGC72_13575 [Planctomycetota bacterium]